jgi:hypothetical protein
MRTAEEIIEQAKQLPLEERRRVLGALEVSLDEEEEASTTKAQLEGPYSRTLAAAGIGHSDFSDVSSNKGKHLAEAYGPKHGRR